MNLQEIKRVIIKVGTSTLTYSTGKLNLRRIEQLVRCLADLKNRGYDVVLVSSGAMGVGVGKLSLMSRPETVRGKQAVAAIGQCELMSIYDRMFAEYCQTVAQILLTKTDLETDEKKQNVTNTFDQLMERLEEKDFETEKIIQFAKDNFGGYRGDASDRVIDEILLQEE